MKKVIIGFILLALVFGVAFIDFRGNEQEVGEVIASDPQDEAFEGNPPRIFLFFLKDGEAWQYKDTELCWRLLVEEESEMERVLVKYEDVVGNEFGWEITQFELADGGGYYRSNGCIIVKSGKAIGTYGLKELYAIDSLNNEVWYRGPEWCDENEEGWECLDDESAIEIKEFILPVTPTPLPVIEV